MIRTFNMDCMEFMKDIPDKYYSLAVVDVNYGIKEDGRKNHTRSKKAKAKDYQEYSRYDNDSPPLEYFNEILRISDNQIFWGANHFISKIPFNSSSWIVWDKLNGDNDFADCELAYTSFKSAVRKFTFRWAGMLQGDMKNKQIRIHPNEKPVPLYKFIFDNYLINGGNVIDTHGGSMSIALAAHDYNVDLDVCELDTKHYNNAIKRLQQHQSQTKLF